MENKTIILSKFQVEAWKQTYGIQNTRYGGLVIGNRHMEDSIKSGVKIVSPIDSNNYSLSEMEGGEYLMCPEATKKHRKRLDEINQYTGRYDEISEDRIKSLFSVIRLKSGMEMLELSGGDYYIIKRSATSKYLEELDKMNELCIKGSLINRSR